MALDDSFIEFLDEELGRIMPETQSRYRAMFAALGFDDRNADFVQFWTVYSDEIYGTLGYLTDLAMDLEDLPSSGTGRLHSQGPAPARYFSLLHDESDDHLLYDRETDEVALVEAGALSGFIENGVASRTWSSFVLFLSEFLRYPR